MITDLKTTSLWDDRYNLPLDPKFDNPHLYCAYISKYFSLNVIEDYIKYLTLCENKDGTYNRWPNKTDDAISHDELIGMAYLSPFAAEKILATLRKGWGKYDNTGTRSFFSSWQYRWLQLVPYLKNKACQKVTIINDLAWALNCVIDALSNDGMSGHLMIWLMKDSMRSYYFSKLAIKFWQSRMNKRGFTDKVMLQTYFYEEADYF